MVYNVSILALFVQTRIMVYNPSVSAKTEPQVISSLGVFLLYRRRRRSFFDTDLRACMVVCDLPHAKRDQPRSFFVACQRLPDPSMK